MVILMKLKDLASVKTAVITCNSPRLKREILCIPGSDCYRKQSDGVVQRPNLKEIWDEVVEEKALIILDKLGLPKTFQTSVLGFVHPIGRCMLTWSMYHGPILELPSTYFVQFLSISYFTQEGIIDKKKAAHAMLLEGNLGIKQKYKLSCLYCFTEAIPDLFKEMTSKDKEEFYNSTRSSEPIHQQELIRFWTYYLKEDVDRLKGPLTLTEYMLEISIKSGLKEAVEYCLKTNTFCRNDIANVTTIVTAVTHLVRSISDPNCLPNYSRYYSSVEDATIEFCVETFCFLLSVMREDQKILFLQEDISGFECLRVLKFFLNWPYQKYCLQAATLMWNFLPEDNYSILILKICDKIESKKGDSEYGDENTFDYRDLLMKFWFLSPERFKRYFFSDHEVPFDSNSFFAIRIRPCVGLLIKLLSLKNVTCEDRRNIKHILSYATDAEKELIISFKEGDVAIELMRKKAWKELDFLFTLFPKVSPEELKRTFSLAKKLWP